MPEADAPKPNTKPNGTKRPELTADQWKQVAEDLKTLAETRKRSSLLHLAAKEDPARYAALNAEVMLPIHEERAKKKAEKEREAKERAEAMAEQARARGLAAEERIAQRTAQILRAGD